jgi:hypothetical protein
MREVNLILPRAFVLFAAFMPTHAIEEPAFEVTTEIGDVELRQYVPYVVDEVLIPASATEAGNKAFRIRPAISFA